MATVYIAIGTPKTGTTALQNFMRRNEAEMKKQGFCYPLMNIGLSGIYKDRNGQFLVYNYNRKESPQQEAAVKERAYQQLGELAKKYQNIILSEEQIWYRCWKKENYWQDVIENFRKINCEVKVIVYLRRQDALVQSLWNQNVKMFRKETMTFQESLESSYFDYFPFDYYAHLQEIAKHVKKENIVVRPYERGQFEGEEHSIFSDFFKIVGLKLTDEFNRDNSVRNRGLEGNFIEIKRLMNEVPEYHAMDDFLSRPVLYGSMYRSDRGQNGKGNMFSYEEQCAYMARFEEGNRKVAEEFMGREDGVLFREPIREAAEWALDREVMYRDIITAMTESFCAQEKRIRKMQQEVNEMKNNLFFRVCRKIKGFFKRK